MGVFSTVNTYDSDGQIPVKHAGGKKAVYRERVSGGDIALGNISFAIYPFFPFSYDWQLSERVVGGGTVFRPQVERDFSYMERIANFKRLAEQGPMYQGGTKAQGFGRVSDPTVTGGDIYERSWSGQLADPSQQPARDEELLNIQAARAGQSDTEWVRRMNRMSFDPELDQGIAGFQLGAQAMMEGVPRGPASADHLMGEGVTSMTGTLRVSALADKIVKDAWESPLVQGTLINAEAEVGREIYKPFGQEGYKSFTPADKGYVGELASEAMTYEDNLIQALEAAGGSFEPEYFSHLYANGNAQVQYLTGRDKYLDKNTQTNQSRRSLEIILASFEQLGVDHELLSRTVGGEETIDISTKEMIAAFGRAKKEIIMEMKIAFPNEPNPQVELMEIAKLTALNLENQMNTLLTGNQQQILEAFDLNNQAGRGLLRRMATPGKVTTDLQTQSAPPAITQGTHKTMKIAVDHWWGDTAGAGANRSMTDLTMSAAGRTFDGMNNQLGHYWRAETGNPVQIAKPTKPTHGPAGIRPLAEARQILSRFRSIALVGDIMNTMNLTQEGTAYFMQTPIAEGYQSIMFVEFLGVDSITRDFIPRNLRVRIHPYIIPTPALARSAVGLESIVHAAAVDVLRAHHPACVQFEQRRNEMTKAFGLMIAMNHTEWDSFSGRSLHNFSDDMVSNPMMTVIGPGVVGGYLTPANILAIMKADLRRVVGTGSALNTGIAKAIKVAHTKTNGATRMWKSAVLQGFREKTGLSNRQSEQMLWKASAGIWSPENDAMTDFKGRGVAAAPIFGFHPSTDQQMTEVANTIRDMDLQDARWRDVGSDLRAILGTGNEGASSLCW